MKICQYCGHTYKRGDCCGNCKIKRDLIRQIREMVQNKKDEIEKEREEKPKPPCQQVSRSCLEVDKNKPE